MTPPPPLSPSQGITPPRPPPSNRDYPASYYQDAAGEEEEPVLEAATTVAAAVDEAWSAPKEEAAPVAQQADIDRLCDLLGGCTPEQAAELLRQGGSLEGAAQLVGISLD